MTESQAVWSLTLTTLMLGISLLIYGPLSDRYGRRIIMLTSFVGTTLTTLAISQLSHQPNTFEQLLWLRALHGLFLGGLPATAIAYIGEEFPRARIAATVGLYISANSIGGIGGRVLSGVISDWWDWQSVFIVLTLSNLAITLVLAYFLPRSQGFIPQTTGLAAAMGYFKQHLSNRALLIAFLIGGGNFMIVLTLYSYLTFLLADEPYSLSNSWLGLLFLTYVAGSFSSALTGYFNRYASCSQQILLGTALIFVGTLSTLHSQLSMIITGLLLNGFGFFLAHSNLSTWVNRHAKTAKASASSLYLVFYYMGASLGSSYLSPFWQYWQWQGVVFGGVIIIVICLWGGLWLYHYEQKPVEGAATSNT